MEKCYQMIDADLLMVEKLWLDQVESLDTFVQQMIWEVDDIDLSHSTLSFDTINLKSQAVSDAFKGFACTFLQKDQVAAYESYLRNYEENLRGDLEFNTIEVDQESVKNFIIASRNLIKDIATKSLNLFKKIVNNSKPMMYAFEKFYSGVLIGENTEVENYVSLILSMFQLRALEDMREQTCRTIADTYTNPTIEFLLKLVSNSRELWPRNYIASNETLLLTDLLSDVTLRINNTTTQNVISEKVLDLVSSLDLKDLTDKIISVATYSAPRSRMA